MKWDKREVEGQSAVGSRQSFLRFSPTFKKLSNTELSDRKGYTMSEEMGNEINKDGSVSGTVDSVIFANEDNGYTVCLLDSEGECITVVGTMPYLSEGDRITAYGAFTDHPTYGTQFKCEYFERILPESKGDILRYLSSGAVKGVGPKTAQRIVDKFGEDTFDVMENHPDWLTQIGGISPKKAATISQSFSEMSGVRDVIMFCRNLCSGAVAMKIYQKWGRESVGRIRENPYRLCSEFSGIGFSRADSIALTVGADKLSYERLSAGLRYIIMSYMQSTGNTLMKREELEVEGEKLLSAPRERLGEVIDGELSRRQLYCITEGEENFIILPEAREAEKYSAQKLCQLSRLCPVIDSSDISLLISRCEKEGNIRYAKLQTDAIYSVLSDGVSVITGGPGTGKTTVIRALITIFRSLGLSCALCAPTGRAAKRMSEATSCEAKTVHRLLEMEFTGDEEKSSFLRNEKNLLEENVFIIDEASMIDVFLLSSFLRAVKPGARVVFIGDANQLPPVGAGNVLRDLISSERFPVVALTQIFRQSEESMIVTNAHLINEGKFPDCTRKDGDFFLLTRHSERDISRTVAELICKRLPKTYGEDIVNSIQVITPSRKGLAGTVELNRSLQELLNPKSPEKAEKSFGEKTFREGDRVMQTKNNYSIEWTKDNISGVGIFNGDIGTVEGVDHSAGTFTIEFDERRCEYGFELSEELEHAYAITVHKSQGSEYPVVLIPLYRCAPMLLTRNLIYTAITRASRMVILIGDPAVLDFMINNEGKCDRLTSLCRYLSEESIS